MVNGNVHTLRLVNANRISWTKFKSMMTIEYCPIEAYNNGFHEMALMCPDLVPNEKKKIKRYIRRFSKRIKKNITSSRPTTLHEAINMARELVEQAVQGRATRISESNKRKAYAAALAEGKNATCYGYGEKGHLRNKCPKRTNQQNEGARARAYMMGNENPQQNPNMVT
nr:hypothetical protein [Tanacetum cinerariifolium]